MKQMLKDAMILFAVTVVSGLLLGVVYQVTKAPIEEQHARQKQAACREVFAGADHFEAAEEFASDGAVSVVVSAYPDETIDEVLHACDAAGNVLGYVVTVTTHEGFNGDIQFMMGVAPDGTLNGISILQISESPGLGARAEEVLKPQFAGKNGGLFEYTKTGAASDQQIDAISGATITTNAVVNGVNAGLTYVYGMMEGGVEE